VSRRSGLGKGIGSLIPTELGTGAEAGGPLVDLPISAIVPNPHQPRNRFDEESLVSLTDSVRELGVLQPVLVRAVGDQYQLIAGERRWRAARRAGLPTIPAIVRQADDRRSLQEALVENLHRQDLNPLEEAAAYQQLIEDHGMTQEQVAQRVGKSRSAVANSVRLFQLPGSIQRMVASGELQAGHARALLGSPDRGFQERLALRVVREGLNVRQVEDLVRVHQASLAGEPGNERATRSRRTERSPALLELEELLGGRLDTRVHVAMSKGRGRVTIEFADLEDLERIYRLMIQGSEPGNDPQPVDNDVYNR
jgi:ParB family chromosome partitioning protein